MPLLGISFHPREFRTSVPFFNERNLDKLFVTEMSLATAASAAIRPQNWPISVWVLILTGLAYVVGTLVYQPPFPCHAPRLLKGYPILGSPRLFSERGRFLSEGRQFAQSGNWSFYFGKMRIVGVSGHDGRQVFFENRDLDFTKG